jgi:hypothetical protein
LPKLNMRTPSSGAVMMLELYVERVTHRCRGRS